MNSQISVLRHFTGKTFLYFSLFCVIPAIGSSQDKNNTISYPQKFPKEVIQDIQYLLQTSTGQTWKPQQDEPSNTGLLLSVKLDENYKTGESCLINSDGLSYVKFEAPTTNGLIYGLYKYLRDLGFKFYLPDSLYTIVPSLKSIFKKTSRMETPFYESGIFSEQVVLEAAERIRITTWKTGGVFGNGEMVLDLNSSSQDTPAKHSILKTLRCSSKTLPGQLLRS